MIKTVSAYLGIIASLIALYIFISGNQTIRTSQKQFTDKPKWLGISFEEENNIIGIKEEEIKHDISSSLSTIKISNLPFQLVIPVFTSKDMVMITVSNSSKIFSLVKRKMKFHDFDDKKSIYSPFKNSAEASGGGLDIY